MLFRSGTKSFFFLLFGDVTVSEKTLSFYSVQKQYNKLKAFAISYW